jgi:medium-chain acyl-[acyl-carrier-protein] hydrolase
MTSPWFTNSAARNPGAEWRLFCFPFAGGSGHEFRTWGEQLPNVEVLGVLYPGRSSRYKTPLIDNLADMVAALQGEVDAYQDKPFAFFGHSLGALIAFELTRSLRKAGKPLPRLLCVSACDAPHLLPVPPILHNLPDEDFIQAIRGFGGTPEAILNHQELLAMLLPVLRADLKVLETYQYQQEPPLNIPLYIAGGANDSVVIKENLLAWEQYAIGRRESQFFTGGHFYFREEQHSLLFPYLRTMLTQGIMSS